MTEPTCPFTVKAHSSYTARSDVEVSIEAGKTYKVTQTDGKYVWWQTQAPDGRYGWFPASYVNVVPDEPQQQAPPVPPTQEQTQPKQRSSSSRKKRDKTTSDTSDIKMKREPIKQKKTHRAKEDPPPPSKPPTCEPDPTPQYVVIQIVEAKDLTPTGSESKTNPCAFIYRRDVYNRVKYPAKTGEVVFNTAQFKKTTSPKWNERFQLNVSDAEREIIVVRIGTGKKERDAIGKDSYGKKFIGEVEFPLRASARDFERPHPQFKWYTLKNGDKEAGQLKIFIEYVDTKEVTKPKDVQHKSHIGWSAEGGFEIENIPPEWKKVFKNVGIKKKDLKNNAELRNNIFDIMTNYQEEADQQAQSAPAVPQSTGGGLPAVPQSTGGGLPAVPQSTGGGLPTAPQSTGGGLPTVPQSTGGGLPAAPQSTGGGLPAATGAPPPLTKGGAVPPPPVVQKASGGVPTITPSNNKPTPAPVPDSRGNLLEQIRMGTQLKKVEVNENEDQPASTGNTLADTLMKALNNHRTALEGSDGDDDESDWSVSDDDY